MLPIQLAKGVDLDELEKYWLMDHEYGLEPKVDGLRLVIVRGKPYSRDGKPLYNLEPMLTELRALPNYLNVVFDGEADCGTWEATMSLLRASVTQKKMPVRFKYHIFDRMTLRQWEVKNVTEALWLRRQTLIEMFREIRREYYEYVAIMPQEEVRVEQVNIRFQTMARQGYEGIVIKDLHASYHFARNTSDRPRTWMKIPVKKTQDCKIIDYVEGLGKCQGMVGSFLVVDESGHTSRVSCKGLDFDERERLLKNFSKECKGKMIECEFKKLTPKGVMYAGQFKRWREDKD